MNRHKLDKIDRSILRDLQANGRMTNVELAANAGISAPPCLRRVRALEDYGYIQSYHADLSASMLGYGVAVFANVALEDTSEKDLQAFIKAVEKMDLVRDCYMIAGDMDFTLRIVAKDWDAYQRFITEELTALKNVRSVKSSLIMKRNFKKPGVPIEE
ncbi:MAG: ArsR family transcriptional regulator [Micavibrio sp.]|nr:ArsR family transcriptional regulator [Micavibrio sp.]|tara:strand:- start:708 stop:1181 length:474 start_codon:yes stop_codon:yes gene_type:complete